MTIEPSDVPLYVQLANLLREQILSGEIPPTQPLPSKRALQREYGVALRTAERAFSVLRDEGLIHTVQGLGVFPVRPENRPRPPGGKS
jgi:DNA-binding GntR family transcriptional regulator